MAVINKRPKIERGETSAESDPNTAGMSEVEKEDYLEMTKKLARLLKMSRAVEKDKPYVRAELVIPLINRIPDTEGKLRAIRNKWELETTRALSLFWINEVAIEMMAIKERYNLSCRPGMAMIGRILKSMKEYAIPT